MIHPNDGAVEPVTNAAAAGSVFVGRARQGLQEVNVTCLDPAGTGARFPSARQSAVSLFDEGLSLFTLATQRAQLSCAAGSWEGKG